VLPGAQKAHFRANARRIGMAKEARTEFSTGTQKGKHLIINNFDNHILFPGKHSKMLWLAFYSATGCRFLEYKLNVNSCKVTLRSRFFIIDPELH
jgi:hypothetical protein